MKALYFVIGLSIGAILAFSYCNFKLSRPTCYEDQFLIRDYANDFVCINADDIQPIKQ